MQPEFWHKKWESNQIGFHLPEVNPYLQRHWAVPATARVLVPLCGKSLDLAWLAGRGHQVLGVELSQKAIDDFFSEHQVTPQVSEKGLFKVYRADSIELWCGDFFALTADDVADCAALYDRAALIALPPQMRQRYVAHLQAILPQACQGLLVTLVYDQQRMDGPPFSVDDAEVVQHFSAGWVPREVERKDVLSGNPRFIENQLEAVEEVVFHLARR